MLPSKRRVNNVDEYRDEDYNLKRFKNSLDSDEDDEEEEAKKENILDPDELEGQEDATVEYYDGIKITPFNMSEELEEGHFDKEGTFIFKKPNERIRDNWLDNIDWIKIEERKNEEEEMSDDENDEPIDKIKIYTEMLELMKPGETVQQAIRRLGGGKVSQSGALNKWVKKKCDEATEMKKDEEKLLLLTSLANKILLTGDMDIYEQSYEKLNFLTTEKQTGHGNEIPPHVNDDEALDMFAETTDDKLFAMSDSVRHDKVIKTNVQTEDDNQNIRKEDEVMWEFKWENDEDSTIYGPHSSSEMNYWVEEGYFKKGVWVRKAGQNSEFYNSCRIDFELYI